MDLGTQLCCSQGSQGGGWGCWVLQGPGRRGWWTPAKGNPLQALVLGAFLGALLKAKQLFFGGFKAVLVPSGLPLSFPLPQPRDTV